MEVRALEPLVGEWRTAVELPGREETIGGRTTFAWLPGGSYLIQHAVVDGPQFPNGIMVIGPDAGGDRIVQHYFDSRGVARVYEIALEDGVLRLWRDGADFAQRYTGRFGVDGTTIRGAWERCDDGTSWQLDFRLGYTRLP
jgi:hypothetical protein